MLLVLDGPGADSHVAQHIGKIRIVPRIEHLVGCRKVRLSQGADMHIADGLDPFDDVRLLVQVRLMCHALVPDAGGARLVRVYPGDQEDTVLYPCLELGKARDVVADRVLFMGRTGADDQHQTTVLAGEDCCNFAVPLCLHLCQIGRQRDAREDLFRTGDLLYVFEAHRAVFLPEISYYSECRPGGRETSNAISLADGKCL